MFAQVYNSTKGMSATWWRNQHQWCQEGGENRRIENRFHLLCLLLPLFRYERYPLSISYHVYYPGCVFSYEYDILVLAIFSTHIR